MDENIEEYQPSDPPSLSDTTEDLRNALNIQAAQLAQAYEWIGYLNYRIELLSAQMGAVGSGELPEKKEQRPRSRTLTSSERLYLVLGSVAAIGGVAAFLFLYSWTR